MAQRDAASIGRKRGPGRPPKSTPAPKKQRLSVLTSPAHHSPGSQTPVASSPIAEKKIPGLPAKVVDGKPLPTLSEPLPLILSDDEYQSIVASAVLPASLDRSRLRWVHEGVFQRYWVKPETGKHAKPPPPDNPEVKWMKHRGHCRIRIEPHMFEADVYVEEKVKPQAQPKQYINSTYAQPYRPPAPNQPYVQPQHQSYQNTGPLPPQQNVAQSGTIQSKPLPAAQHPTPVNTPPPQSHPPPPPPPPRIPPSPSPATPQQPDKKPLIHDPVISMLAARASSDPKLKALMREVAAGNAMPEQLLIFQKHIDELTAIISKQKKDEEARMAKEQQRADVIQYDGPSDKKAQPLAHPPQSRPPPPYQPQQHPPPPPPPAPPAYRQPVWVPPAPASLPVILGFTTPGATEDRFLFPQHSILESLSPQHTLVSYIVTRKAREAKDLSGLDVEKEYWQPVTMMVEVAYGREEILACIRRWVKPAEEVCKHMEEVMARCERAPQTYLPLRLPFKSTLVDETPKESTPVVVEERAKPKASLKQTKKTAAANTTLLENKEVVAPKAGEATPKPDGAQVPDPGLSASNTTAAGAEGDRATTDNKEPSGDGSVATTSTPAAAEEAPDENRPKRSVRKSVRISEA